MLNITGQAFPSALLCCARAFGRKEFHLCESGWPDGRRALICMLTWSVIILAETLEVLMSSDQQRDPEEFNVYPPSIKRLNFAIGIVAALFMICCVRLGLLYPPKPDDPQKLTKEILLMIWGLGVPSWFAFEYWCLYRRFGTHFERFKYHQDLMAKVWLACAAILTLLFFGLPTK